MLFFQEKYFIMWHFSANARSETTGYLLANEGIKTALFSKDVMTEQSKVIFFSFTRSRKEEGQADK